MDKETCGGLDRTQTEKKRKQIEMTERNRKQVNSGGWNGHRKRSEYKRPSTKQPRKTTQITREIIHVHTRIKEILRIPAESSGKEEPTIIIMFTKSLRNTFTKLKSNAKEAANKAVSAVKHKGQLSDIPDEMLWQW